MSGIDNIACSLRDLLTEKEIIARCELLVKTYDFVKAAHLSDSEKEEMHEIAGKCIAPGIFASIMNDTPIFSNIPRLDTYTQLNGRIFHFLHTKKYSKQDFDDAYRMFLRALPELKAILHSSMTDMLKDFMRDAGYLLAEDGSQGLRFGSGERKVTAQVFASINLLDYKLCQLHPGEDCVFLIPSGESLEPFMQFFRETGQAWEEAGVQIWIVNLEKGSIDPFIGYTSDLDIYNQFNNPRLAEIVRTNWGKK